LVAVTVKVYIVPFVSPLTVRGLPVPVVVFAPGLEVTVKPVMAAPPVLEGAVKLTVAMPFPAVAVPMVGAPDTVSGVTLLEFADAAPVPTLLVAVTVKVYGVPFVSPLTVRGLPVPVMVFAPGLEVTV
jgi:hypothetical protein